MPRFAIIGAGDLGQQIAQHVGGAVFFDDTRRAGERTPGGVVLGSLAEVRKEYSSGAFDELLMGVGYKHLETRQRIFETFAGDVPFGRFVHPSAYVDKSAKLGAGTFISPGCIVDLNASVEDNVFLYSGCIVSHDASIGAHSFFAPGVRVAGRVRTGKRSFFGIGTVIRDGLSLADDVQTGAGCVVVHQLTESGTYVGVPARMLR